jgi:hypothetical protein
MGKRLKQSAGGIATLYGVATSSPFFKLLDWIARFELLGSLAAFTKRQLEVIALDGGWPQIVVPGVVFIIGLSAMFDINPRLWWRQKQLEKGAYAAESETIETQPAGIGSKVSSRSQDRSIWDRAAEPERGSFLRHLIDAKQKSAVEHALKPKRDVPLGPAIAYACLGTWDAVEELPRLIKAETATAKLKVFEQKAGDGDLAVWGKDRDDDGGEDLWHTIHVPVPTEHWRTHWVDPGSLVGRTRTADRPPYSDDKRFYDLMVSRVQIEEEFPRNQSAPPPPSLAQTAPEPATEKWLSLDQAVRYLAKGSCWGQIQDQSDPYFSINLGIQLRDALACGDLTARGRKFHVLRGGIKTPPFASAGAHSQRLLGGGAH